MCFTLFYMISFGVEFWQRFGWVEQYNVAHSLAVITWWLYVLGYVFWAIKIGVRLIRGVLSLVLLSFKIQKLERHDCFRLYTHYLFLTVFSDCSCCEVNFEVIHCQVNHTIPCALDLYHHDISNANKFSNGLFEHCL